MALQKLHEFLSSGLTFQKQAMFEFRYPTLFDEESFLIDQLGFPKLDTTIGYAYVDGLQIPVHSTVKPDNEITFAMYVEEEFLKDGGKFASIFAMLLDEDHRENFNCNAGDIINAYIFPLKTPKYGEKQSDNFDCLTLCNAIIKSIALNGGFSANSSTLIKFDVTLSFSYIQKSNRKMCV